MEKKISINYIQLASFEELAEEDIALLQEAKAILNKAYAPYSNFQVAAVGKLKNGALVAGTNQENASYPVGICAERVLLSTASILHTNEAIETIAITYRNLNGASAKPISPCGICRQSLVEYEQRTNAAIRIILAGETGNIIILNSASDLLPLSFGSADMK